MWKHLYKFFMRRKRQPLTKSFTRVILGKPKDLRDKSIFHHLSLIPFLAWVGLGADGLSSSAYGPEESFRALNEYHFLAVGLAAMTAITVFLISAAYRRIIEEFPHGGGGYVVASKLLGRKVGVVSGCALLVDYVLTITISIAAAGDAIFSFLPPEWQGWKMTFEVVTILFLSVLNVRGVKESVVTLTPIFLVFLITHLVIITWGILSHGSQLPETANGLVGEFHQAKSTIGLWPICLLFLHSYSLGGGTYTGIEAVSNGLPIMREPRVQTAKRTMTYMATSLAFTAAGLLLCYLLWHVRPEEGKTLNAVLFAQIAHGMPFDKFFVILCLASEGLLLVVAAQAGFIDGPRVLANMANDSWVPRRFAALSDRLTTANGIFLMSVSSLLALLYTKGNVSELVVMYSINVFLTFSLSILGMFVHHWKFDRNFKDLLLFASGLALCVTILVVTIFEKFLAGGWITLTVTGALVLLCLWIKSHYLEVAQKLHKLYIGLDRLKPRDRPLPPLDLTDRTAAVLVGGYGGLGIHTVQTILKTFPGVYKNFVFLSVGVLDSGGFKGQDAVDALTKETEKMLMKYVNLSESLGIPATFRFGVGTDISKEAYTICKMLTEECPKVVFFTGKIIFEEEKWFQRLLHNETAFTMQKYLQLAGHTMVILPAKVD